MQMAVLSVHTDASLNDLGAVLYQKQDKKRVVAYASRSLKPSEKKYLAHKRELLALKWVICEKFRDYLYGSKYVLKRVSFGSKDCTKELKLECAYFLGQTS